MTSTREVRCARPCVFSAARWASPSSSVGERGKSACARRDSGVTRSRSTGPATRARPREAAGLYRGDFLEGFHASEVAPEFDFWLETNGRG